MTTIVLAVATLVPWESTLAAERLPSGGSEVVAANDSRSAVQPLAIAPAMTLSIEQRRKLLADANEQYSRALSQAASDSAEAKQAFSDAADKYQLIIDSGVRNARLFCNAGNAYLQSGQTGRAIANYRRSLQIDSTNRVAQTNLAYADGLAKATTNAAETTLNSKPISADASKANDWIGRYVSPRGELMIMFCAWFVLWATVGSRLLGMSLPWKTIASAAIVLFAVTATSYAMSWHESARRMVVVIPPRVALREGDGPSFPTVPQSQLAEGRTVELIKQRGDWLQIRTENGQTGWLPKKAVEII